MKHPAKYFGVGAVVIGLGFSASTATFAAGMAHGSGVSFRGGVSGGFHTGSYGGYYGGARGSYYGGYHGGYYGGYRGGYGGGYYYPGGWYGGYPLAYSYSYIDPPVPYYYSSPAVGYNSSPIVYSAPPVVYSSPPAVYSAQAPATAPAAQSAPPPQPEKPGPPLVVADIKALAKAEVSSEVIISQIRSSRTFYHLTTSEIIDLKNSGVSEKVIDYMINTATP